MSHNNEKSVCVTKSIAKNSKLLIFCDGFSGINVSNITLRKIIGPNRWPGKMINMCHNPFGPVITDYDRSWILGHSQIPPEPSSFKLEVIILLI